MIQSPHVIDVVKLEHIVEEMGGWSTPGPGNALFRRFAFRSFQDAWTWMTEIVPFIIEQDHHPDWRNIYRDVEVTLRTHDQGGVTQKDIKLARYMDKQYQRFDVRKNGAIETS